MKNYIIGIVLALALVMGVVAFAETAEPATDSIPSVSEEAPNEGAASEAPSTEAEKADNNAALQEALGAYRSAQESKYVDDLTEELNGYVKAGTMTQEQVDLILNSVKERLAAKNGECPNCGYQFQNDAPRMGGQRGQRGGWMMQGGQMNGQMPGGRMKGQMPDAQSGATPNGLMNGQQQVPQR